MGWTVHHWRRMSGPLGPASAWPEGRAFDAACVRLSKDKVAFEMALHAAASVLKPEVPVWVYGANDEGIKSAAKRMTTVCDPVTVVDARRHCRVLEGHLRSDPTHLKSSLEDWATTCQLEFEDSVIAQRSYPGVFAKGRLDPGTKLLLSTLPALGEADVVLDYAAGSGVIGLGLKQRQPKLTLTLLEADAVALEAAKHNLPDATAVLGHTLKDLPTSTPFDTIVANPPYHSGKARSTAVIARLIQGAPEHLSGGGSLWMVLQSQVDVLTELNAHFESVEVAAHDRRYKVWRASTAKC
jgi:16S rRNA (guanine1207-N2)-methyltransferase